MNHTRRSFLHLAALSLLLAASTPAQDPGSFLGTWRWSTAETATSSPDRWLTLKKEGDAITGTLSGSERDDHLSVEQLKITGNRISFNIAQELQGRSFTHAYSGILTNGTLTGKVIIQQETTKTSHDWVAKKVTPKFNYALPSDYTSFWACSNHDDPVHTATSEAEMRTLTKEHGCSGWRRN